jgi:hypothetical protein
MMHVKFYAISILFLVAVGACFLLIALGYGPNRGIAADNAQTNIGGHNQLTVGFLEKVLLPKIETNSGRYDVEMEAVEYWIK